MLRAEKRLQEYALSLHAVIVTVRSTLGCRSDLFDRKKGVLGDEYREST